MRRSQNALLNLDSFLDLLSNTVGALLLILILGMIGGASVCVRPYEAFRGAVYYLTVRDNAASELPSEPRSLTDDWVLYSDSGLPAGCLAFRLQELRHWETLDDLSSPRSSLRAAINRLDPGRDALVVLVFPDSFAAFRVVRSIAREHGIQVGWQPVEDGINSCPGNVSDNDILVEPSRGKR